MKGKQPPRARIPGPAPGPGPEGEDVLETPRRYDKPLPELEKIGALWKRKSKKGTIFLSGVCHDEKILVFQVREEYRSNPKSPHYTIMRSKQEDEDVPF